MAVLAAAASVPQNYYSSLEGKTGVELKRAVKAIVQSHHTKITYGDDTWEAFRLTDVREENGQKFWYDMYSDERVPVGKSKPDNGVMNIEHSVAKSWWGGTKNNAYCDIVHLNPSNSNANSRKSNYPMAKIGSKSWTNGVTNIGSPAAGYGGGSRNVYEPCDLYKGDMARVFMYMFTVYDDLGWLSDTAWMYDTSSPLMLKPWAYKMLLEWSAQDPVSEKEYNRNEGVYASNQHGRNPFIDLPGLGEYIWGAKSGQPYHVEIGQKPDGDPNPDPKPDPDPDPDPQPDPDPDPNPPTTEKGNWQLVASQGDLYDGARYLIGSSEEGVIMSTTLSSTYMKHIDGVEIVDGKYIKDVSAGAAQVKLHAAAGKYALEVMDMKDKSLGYLACTEVKTMTLTDNAADQGAAATITFTGGNVSVVYGSSATSGAGALYYNASAPRFTTYTSVQKPLRFYRLIEESSGVCDAATDDSFLVEVWGRNILVPEGAVIMDLSGRRVDGRDLTPGLYIVAKPTFARSVKVIIK